MHIRAMPRTSTNGQSTAPRQASRRQQECCRPSWSAFISKGSRIRPNPVNHGPVGLVRRLLLPLDAGDFDRYLSQDQSAMAIETV
jgi:hypothetical protein